MNTDSKALPSEAIELESRTFTVQFTMYSLLKFKRLTGKNILKGDLDSREPEDMIHFLWAGLLAHEPDLDGEVIDGKPDATLQKNLDRVAKMMTFDKFAEIGRVLNKAFLNAMPEVKEGNNSQKK